MTALLSSPRRTLGAARRTVRQARMVARALASQDHPVLAQVVPIRRCNLSCAYCHEFDDHSAPVATDEMLRRVDALTRLGTAIVELSGGEPLLHPDVDAIVRRIRVNGMLAGLLTNGYLLTADRIRRLNRAGLDHLQISIDNASPDAISKKSLSVLDSRLVLLARHRAFSVNINSVVGGDLADPQAALIIARRARELGFTATVGLIHDGAGRLIPLRPAQRAVFDEIERLTVSPYSVARPIQFQRNLAAGRPNEWQCGAGARYLYICEDGLVHWCSQQRGYPAIPLADYTRAHLERELRTVKPCAPYCTVSCVHRVAWLDTLRERPMDTLTALLADQPGSRVPMSVRLLRWMFLGSRRRDFFRSAALRLLRVR